MHCEAPGVHTPGAASAAAATPPSLDAGPGGATALPESADAKTRASEGPPTSASDRSASDAEGTPLSSREVAPGSGGDEGVGSTLGSASSAALKLSIPRIFPQPADVLDSEQTRATASRESRVLLRVFMSVAPGKSGSVGPQRQRDAWLIEPRRSEKESHAYRRQHSSRDEAHAGQLRVIGGAVVRPHRAG